MDVLWAFFLWASRASFVSWPPLLLSRAPQAPERRDMPPVQQELCHHQFGRRHCEAVGPENRRIYPEPGDAGERGQWRCGVAHPGLQHQAGVRSGQPQRHRGDQAAGAGLWRGHEVMGNVTGREKNGRREREARQPVGSRIQKQE